MKSTLFKTASGFGETFKKDAAILASLTPKQLDEVGKGIHEHTAHVHGAIQRLGNVIQRIQLLD